MILSRGVLNGAAINALTVNGDGIVHSASGAGLLRAIDAAQVARRTLAKGTDVLTFIHQLSAVLRRNAASTSQFSFGEHVTPVKWLCGNSMSSIFMKSAVKSAAWKTGAGVDTFALKEISEFATRKSITVNGQLSLDDSGSATHRHGIHASAEMSLAGFVYANTYGAIKGTGTVGLQQKSTVVRVVAGKAESRITQIDRAAAAAWLSAGSDDLLHLSASVDAVRWGIGKSLAITVLHAEVQPTRVLAPSSESVLTMQDNASSTRWGVGQAYSLIVQMDGAGANRRRQINTASKTVLKATSDPTRRQQSGSVSLISLVGSIKLPHVYMKPIDACRSYNIRYEPRDFIVPHEAREMLAASETRELIVPEEKRDMSYHCCGDAK